MKGNGPLHAAGALHLRKNPGTHGIVGWLGPSAVLDAFGEENISPTGTRTAYHPAHILITITTTLGTRS